MGYSKREDFAKVLGMPIGTLANYERGNTKPDSEALAAYLIQGINITWLLTGDGSMFNDWSKAPASTRSVDAEVMEKIARIVTAVHKDAAIKITDEKVTVETTGLYNELVSRVTDMSDPDEIEAALPQLRYILKKRIDQAAIAPASGKRSVSK